jgi:transposase
MTPGGIVMDLGGFDVPSLPGFIVRFPLLGTIPVGRFEAAGSRALLRSREMLVRSRVMLDNHLRGILKAFGLKVGKVDPGRLDR